MLKTHTHISLEKDKNNLFEKVPNAHLAIRVSVARVTGKDVKIVFKKFFFFNCLSLPFKVVLKLQES
jgi:hypothetical protein